MVIDNIPEFLARVKEAFPKYHFDLQHQGAGWARAFVSILFTKEMIDKLDPDECEGGLPEIGTPLSLGRINFKPTDDGKHTIYGVKHYKPDDMEYAPDDDFFYQFQTWVQTGTIIDVGQFVEQAKKIRQQKIDEQQKWRDEHKIPERADGKTRHRSRLSNKWMGEFRRLVEGEVQLVILESVWLQS